MSFEDMLSLGQFFLLYLKRTCPLCSLIYIKWKFSDIAIKQGLYYDSNMYKINIYEKECNCSADSVSQEVFAYFCRIQDKMSLLKIIWNALGTVNVRVQDGYEGIWNEQNISLASRNFGNRQFGDQQRNVEGYFGRGL